MPKNTKRVTRKIADGIEVIRVGFPHIFQINFTSQAGQYIVARVSAHNRDHAIGRIRQKYGELTIIGNVKKLTADGEHDSGVFHKIGRGLLFVHNKLGEMEI